VRGRATNLLEFCSNFKKNHLNEKSRREERKKNSLAFTAAEIVK
jgi:hypothetical protein